MLPAPAPAPAAEEARELVKRYDVNGDNQIDYAEFLQVLLALLHCFCVAHALPAAALWCPAQSFCSLVVESWRPGPAWPDPVSPPPCCSPAPPA